MAFAFAHRLLWVVSAGCLMAGCMATKPVADQHYHLYSFAELQQHAAEHMNAARGSGVDDNAAVALAKAEALARLARAFTALSGRRNDVIGPAALGPAQCYNHKGRLVGPSLDI
jgi:hypothetical protein